MAGIPFHGHSKVIEFAPNDREVNENVGGIPSKFVWNYRPENGGTHLDLQVEYEVPTRVLGKLAEKIVRKGAFSTGCYDILTPLRQVPGTSKVPGTSPARNIICRSTAGNALVRPRLILTYD